MAKRKRNKLQQRRAEHKKNVRRHYEYQIKMKQYANQIVNEGLQIMRMNAHNPTNEENKNEPTNDNE